MWMSWSYFSILGVTLKFQISWVRCGWCQVATIFDLLLYCHPDSVLLLYHTLPICLIIFGAYMNILFVAKVKIFKLSKWLCRSSTIEFTLEHRKVVTFWAHCPISFQQVSFWYLFSEFHLTIYQSNTRVWLRSIAELGTFTLLDYLCFVTGCSPSFETQVFWDLRFGCLHLLLILIMPWPSCDLDFGM